MALKTNTRIRMAVGYIVALLILSWAGTLVYQNILQFRENRKWVTHTRDVLEQLQTLLTSLEEAQSGERGYVIAGDQQYLRTFDSSQRQALQAFEAIQLLTADNRSQQDTLTALRPHLLAELQELTDTVKVRQQQGMQPALQAAVAGRDLQEMDRIRSLIATMQQEENRLLVSRRVRNEASFGRTEMLLATAVAMQFVLLTIVFLFVSRDFANREKFEAEIAKANNLLKAVVEGSVEGIFAKDLGGRYLLINEAGAHSIGKSPHEIVGKKDSELYDDVSAQKLAAEDQEVLSSGTALTYQRLLTTNDQTRIVASSKKPFRDGVGRVAGVVGVFNDVTERVHAERELREAKEIYRRLVEEGQGLICMHDLSGNLLSVNRAAAEIIGYTAGTGRPVNLREFLPPRDHSNFELYLQEIAAKGEHAGVMRIVDSTGAIRFWAYRNRRVVEAGKPAYIVGHAQDITAQRIAEKALQASEEKLRTALENEKNVSRVDFLTQIANRRAFSEILDLEIKRSRRYRRPMVLAYMDLDNFKQVNDRLGHETGDELLRLTAQTIRANIRSTDTVARLGGDEFALLLPETDHQPACIVISKLRRILLEAIEARHSNITVSIGLACFEVPGESIEAIIKTADDLMYSAKNQGKNCVATAYVKSETVPVV
jgi:diguanylate cyclase (GGDEF)-like protein/PAS domain S-box-containing protein